MTSNERIRYLRKDILKLNQQDFAKKINISRSNLANIEVNQVSLTDRVIYDICRELNINENWIRQGIDPIFSEGNDPTINEIAKAYKSLNDDNKKYLFGYVQRLLDEQKSLEE